MAKSKSNRKSHKKSHGHRKVSVYARGVSKLHKQRKASSKGKKIKLLMPKKGTEAYQKVMKLGKSA